MDVQIKSEDLGNDDYILYGFVGGIYYFDVVKSVSWNWGEEQIIHRGEVTNVAGAVLYTTKEPHPDKMCAYIDIMGYILNNLRRTYAYRQISSSDFNFIPIDG